MTYQNEFDKSGRSSIDGQRAEDNFVRLFESRFGVKPIKATDYQNKHDHIDYFMSVKGHKASVDVKSWKRKKDVVVIEFISYGNLGWLYGKADYIAFEMPDEQSFIMIKRSLLVEFIKKVCIVYFTNDKSETPYNIYVRWKEKDNKKIYDCYTKIPRSEILRLEHWVLK